MSWRNFDKAGNCPEDLKKEPAGLLVWDSLASVPLNDFKRSQDLEPAKNLYIDR